LQRVLAITVKKERCALSAGFSGPWFIGEVIDGHNGAGFAFGVFVDGHFLEGGLTYVVGVMQVIQDLGLGTKNLFFSEITRNVQN